VLCIDLRRAERFGTQFVEPGKRHDLQLAFRKEKLKKDGFKTGIDIYDEVSLLHSSAQLSCTISAVLLTVQRRHGSPHMTHYKNWGVTQLPQYHCSGGVGKKQHGTAHFGSPCSPCHSSPESIDTESLIRRIELISQLDVANAIVQAETARKQQRATRFGTENSAPSYAPAEVPEDEVKKQQRAERFGVEYKAAEGLMDIGNFLLKLLEC